MTSKNKYVKKDSSIIEESLNSPIARNYTTTPENVNTNIDKSKSDNTDKAQDEKLPAVRNIRPNNFISPLDRFSGILFGCNEKVNTQKIMKKLLAGDAEIKMDAKGKLTILVSMRFEDLPKNLQSKLNDRFIRAVCDTITSLKLAGNEYISPKLIACAMTGYSLKNSNPTDEFINQIIEAVEILRHTWVKIDASNEAKARGYNFKEVEFDGMLAPMNALKLVLMNGNKILAYHVLSEPILYSYAKQKNQVLSVDKDILKFPENENEDTKRRATLITMTRENIILQRYLIERIEIMKNSNNDQDGRIISYQTIYKIMNAQNSSKIEKKRIRDRVKIFLNDWKNKKYIMKYREEKEKGIIKNILIELYEDHEENESENKA